MRFSLLFLLSVVLVLGVGLLISGASLADRGDNNARRARAETLVLGFFGCDDFVPDDEPRRSSARWGFEGWEGVGRFGFGETQSQPASTLLEFLGNFGETCRGLTQEIQSVAQALGCATGPITVGVDEPEAFAQGFGFTCSGRRDRIVGAMAEISRAILEFRR